MLTLIKSIAAVAIFAAAAGTAAAQPATDPAPPTAVVSFADLDIGTTAGLRVLQGRIHGAASRLCVSGGRKSLQVQLAERRCMSAAVTSAQVGVEQALAKRAVLMASRSEPRVGR